MTVWDSLRLSLSSLRGGIVRTMLTLLSLAVGVGAVLTVLTLGDAGERRVEAEIAKLGVNKVWIRSGSDRSALKETDARLIEKAVQAPACAGAYTMTSVSFARKAALIQVAGFDAEAFTVHAPKILAGRMLNPEDFSGSNAVCLIDEVLDEYLGGDMLGKQLRAANRRIRVVGIIKPMSLQTLSGGNGMMVLPLTTSMDTFDTQVTEITVLIQPGQETQTVVQLAQDALGAGDYRTDTLEKEIDAAREIVRIFVMVLLCVAFVCMLSGGIGVMNVMLLSVCERRNEIGLMKAIGGTSPQIALLFLLEAAVYSLMGGVLGVLLGWGMIFGFGRFIGLQAEVQITTVIPILASAALMGVCFGVAPAIKAASLQPVEALRAE